MVPSDVRNIYIFSLFFFFSLGIKLCWEFGGTAENIDDVLFARCVVTIHGGLCKGRGGDTQPAQPVAEVGRRNRGG